MFAEFPDLPPLEAPPPPTINPQPWGSNDVQINNDKDNQNNAFADNFADSKTQQQQQETSSFSVDFAANFADKPKANVEKLPDSAEYLAALERKLEKVSKKGGNLLSDLALRREDEMRRFLADKNSIVDATMLGQTATTTTTTTNEEGPEDQQGLNNKIISGNHIQNKMERISVETI